MMNVEREREREREERERGTNDYITLWDPLLIVRQNMKLMIRR